MSRLEDNFRKVEPYVPGEQPNLPDMVKLNTNENPYPPSPKVAEALQKFELDSLRLYPDPASTDLVNALAERYHVQADQVYTGVGSDDVLAIAFLTFFNSGKPILFPDITYSFYDVWAELFQIPYERPALDDAFALRLEDYQCENGGIVIANPNAPTGIRQSEEFLRAVIEANPNVVVIIDEAYADFSGYTALPLVDEYENVVVVQTFSKSRSMAGMRIGHAIGNAKLIKAMNDVRYSFNSYPMTRLSVALGVAALSDQDYFEETTAKIVATRERTKQALTELGFTFGDSMTNFIFATHKTVPATHLFEELRKQHIFVRYFSNPRIDNYLRISIGTDAIIICGTTGESATLSEEEHANVIRFAIERVNHRIPVIAGTGSNCTATAVQLSKEASEAGAEGVLVVTPYYNKATQNGLIAHYKKIASEITAPIILYNVPSRTGCGMTPQTIATLIKDVDNIAGVKEASGNISAVAQILHLCDGNVDLYSGNDDQTIPMLSLGAKGVISVLSNVAPKYTHEMVMNYLNGNVKQSAKMQLDALPLCDALFCEVNPIPVKAAMNMMGKNVGSLRAPLTEMEDANKEILKREMAAMHLI